MVLALGLGKHAKASHVMGGEITWECLTSGANAGKFVFELKLYRDCNGIALNDNPNLRVWNHPSLSTITMTLVSATDISPDCTIFPGSMQLSCGAGPPFTGQAGNGQGAVQENIYRSLPINLNGTPPPGGWVFSWGICCRNNAVTNIVNSSGATPLFRAIMYPYTPPGSATPLTTNICYDSSPKFQETANTVICTGYPFTYNHNAFDKELDSLYYSWGDPYNLNGSATSWNPPTNPVVVSWNTGYSTASPLPGPAANPSNIAANMDPASGQISYLSNTSGQFVTCARVESWKCNQLVAEIFREIQVTLINCADPNTPPGLLITPAPGSVPLNISGSVISATAMAGDLVAFRLNATDFDFTPVTFLPQNITFSATGSQLGTPLSNANSGCLNPPCATIVPGTGQSSFVNPTNNLIDFSWTTDCSHLAVSNGCGSFSNTYTFALRMQDDFCPAPAISIATLRVTVLADPSQPPQLSCVNFDPSGAVDLSWVPPTDTGFSFGRYVIYYKPNSPANAVFTAVDTVSGWNTTNRLLTGLANNGDGLYMMRVLSHCGYISDPSDTLGLFILNVNAPPPPNNNSADLFWGPIGPGNYNYEIWAESPPGANNWVNIGSTADTSFVVSSSFCNALVNFQVRVMLGGNPCGSTLDSARFFDNLNIDIMVIDSISVDAGGRAALSWQNSPSGDVVNYYLMQLDRATNLFNIIDTVPVNTPMPYTNVNSQAANGSEVYKVISVDSCGNQSDDLAVVRHKTIYVRNFLDKCTGTNSLNWTRYDGFNVHEYRIMLDYTPAGGLPQPTVLLATLGANDTTYRQAGLINGSQYCYTIRAWDTINNVSAVGNRICFEANVPNRSRLLYMATATTVDGGIETYTFLDGTADVVSYDIERAQNPIGPFISIGTVPKPAQPPYTIAYSDFGVDPDNRVYFYRVSALDSCGARDTVSNLSRNILLKVEARGDLSNRLSWNPYGNWGGVVGAYHIWRSNQPNYGFDLVATLPGTDTSYFDYFGANQTNPQFCYYVEAEEVNNPLNFVDITGRPFRSRSNVDCTTHKARVFLPSAFNPNSDNVTNRLYGPSEVFSDVSAYRFYILNRWGEVMFDSNNPLEKWDGSYNGQPAPIGVYQYFLTYQSNNEVPIVDRGFFTLIR